MHYLLHEFAPFQGGCIGYARSGGKGRCTLNESNNEVYCNLFPCTIPHGLFSNQTLNDHDLESHEKIQAFPHLPGSYPEVCLEGV